MTKNLFWMICLLLGLILFSGCAVMETNTRPHSYYESSDVNKAPAEGSLFSSDKSIMSDVDIQRVLTFRYIPQKQNRIGVLTIAHRNWFGYSDELSRAGTEVQNKLVSALRKSTLVYDASYLPSLLIPEKRTVGYFREAAARYQADLLLIYQPSCRTYDKFKLFSSDKSKAYCNVEAILLDTRSGVVPFTATASRDFVAEKNENDLNFQETMRRAELNALSDALAEIAASAVRFLEIASK